MKNRRRISNIEETIVEPCDVNGKNKIFTSSETKIFRDFIDGIIFIYSREFLIFKGKCAMK